MLRYVLRVALCLAILFMLAAGWIGYTHHRARLDLSDQDDRYAVEKSIAMVPASGEIHAEHVGFVDPILFYKASVTPNEVAWLAKLPEVTPFDGPGHAPLWWRLSLWWDGGNPDMKYFRTNAHSPCLFAYNKQKGMVYGTFGVE
ncbi:MAG: hypothetical protein EOP87_19665 [Verrucomicrobiaceae bacterium]|nr:MAG: hypothetical protein EOP87_19665 [Verrucomicrobiaceae bacterium]